MKKIQSLLLLAAASLLIFVTGCSPQRIVWSPDGTKAAVVGENGLYLSDANGKMSGLLASNMVMAEWFPDSQRMALVRKTEFENWAELKPHIRAENRDFVLETNAQKDITLYELLVGTIAHGQITLGPALIQTQQQPGVFSIRISPTQKAIALVTDAHHHDESRLWLVAADGSAAAKIVSENAATHPDWTRDGHSLVYINAIGETTANDDMLFGSLVRRQVINDAGAVEIQDGHEDLAGMLFAPYFGVRCFDDGRILFVGFDVQLPATADDMPKKPQILAWDPRHKGTLTRMISRAALDQFPDDLQFFDVSPDEKNLLLAGGKGAVKVLSLVDGNMKDVYSGADKDVASFPCWRGDEVCYLTLAPTNSPHTWEVSLWKGGTNRVISSNWPAEVREGFLDK